MRDLRHIRSRLVDQGKEPTTVSLVLSNDGLFHVRVQYGDEVEDCRRATTPDECMEIAMDDLLAPFYKRPYRG